MLIADLVRLGKEVSKTRQTATATIELIASLEDSVGGFYRHVFIVEIAGDKGRGEVAVHPYVDWSERRVKGKRESFVPQKSRAITAPFMMPTGGNPRAPQGSYGIPAYIVYERDFLEFSGNSNLIANFLLARSHRTVGFSISEEQLEWAAKGLARAFAACDTGAKDKYLGVILLCYCQEGGLFEYRGQDAGDLDQIPVLASGIYPGKLIYAMLERYIPALWEAKFQEGSEKGSSDGPDASCSFCFAHRSVVSAYCKSWPWMPTTWEAPLPQPLGAKNLVKAVAVCVDCYKYLTLGANLVNAGITRMQNWLVKEIFQPTNVTDTGSRKVETIYGLAYVLPLLDGALCEIDQVEDFVDAYGSLRTTSRGAGLHLDRLLGLDYRLSDELAHDHMRLTILYFSGDLSRSNIDLRASIEDVIPSVAGILDELLIEVAQFALELYMELNPQANEGQLVWVQERYSSLPYILAKAYGSGSVWQSLAAALHRQNLTAGRLVSACSARMNGLSRRLPDAIWGLRQEVVFYLTFMCFLQLYSQRIRMKKRSETVRPWVKLQDYIAKTPVEELSVTDVEELGFACGQLTGDYAGFYWYITKTNDGQGKDFLKTRVMTFGSSLTPKAIVERAMMRFHDYAVRTNMPIGLISELLTRTGAVLAIYSAMELEVARESQRFMLGFWSGYSLSGVRRKRHRVDDNLHDETAVVNRRGAV